MDGFENLVSAVVGAVMQVASEVIEEVSTYQAALGAMADIANIYEDGTVDEDEEDRLLNDLKLVVGAFILGIGSSFAVGEDESDDDEDSQGDFNGIQMQVTDGAAVTYNGAELSDYDDYSDYDSENIFDKMKRYGKDFTIGLGYSWDQNFSYGTITHMAGMNDDNLPDSTACKTGKVLGDVGAIITRGVETGAGVGMESGGVVLDSTGAGALVGVPANVAGAVLATDGVAGAYRASNRLANDTMSLMSRPANLSPNGAGRNGAFREAKRKSGIPVTEQPKKVTPAVDKRGNRIPGKDYDFGDGKVIRDHSGGHEFPDDPSQNRGPHFNDPEGNHYDY